MIYYRDSAGMLWRSYENRHYAWIDFMEMWVFMLRPKDRTYSQLSRLELRLRKLE